LRIRSLPSPRIDASACTRKVAPVALVNRLPEVRFRFPLSIHNPDPEFTKRRERFLTLLPEMTIPPSAERTPLPLKVPPLQLQVLATATVAEPLSVPALSVKDSMGKLLLLMFNVPLLMVTVPSPLTLPVRFTVPADSVVRPNTSRLPEMFTVPPSKERFAAVRAALIATLWVPPANSTVPEKVSIAPSITPVYVPPPDSDNVPSCTKIVPVLMSGRLLNEVVPVDVLRNVPALSTRAPTPA